MHGLHSKEAIWNFFSELNLFVSIFDLSNTFFGDIFLDSNYLLMSNFKLY